MEPAYNEDDYIPLNEKLRAEIKMTRDKIDQIKKWFKEDHELSEREWRMTVGEKELIDEVHFKLKADFGSSRKIEWAI